MIDLSFLERQKVRKATNAALRAEKYRREAAKITEEQFQANLAAWHENPIGPEPKRDVVMPAYLFKAPKRFRAPKRKPKVKPQSTSSPGVRYDGTFELVRRE